MKTANRTQTADSSLNSECTVLGQQTLSSSARFIGDARTGKHTRDFFLPLINPDRTN